MDVIILGVLVWWLAGEDLFPLDPIEEKEKDDQSWLTIEN